MLEKLFHGTSGSKPPRGLRPAHVIGLPVFSLYLYPSTSSTQFTGPQSDLNLEIQNHGPALEVAQSPAAEHPSVPAGAEAGSSARSTAVADTDTDLIEPAPPDPAQDDVRAATTIQPRRRRSSRLSALLHRRSAGGDHLNGSQSSGNPQPGPGPEPGAEPEWVSESQRPEVVVTTGGTKHKFWHGITSVGKEKVHDAKPTRA
ncbi:uncharacterized protein A1O5_12228 [Cladophialophora psammophila CBS 110553]|uniref:Uncharacterized protein n=1 Tax=Cladophialophora psammophila CBS 110553 TaxID=1182543 RepID=W9VUG6_9EURO|nr:uncharacterized protein A1O5_12228 [Cladophialophora psammophila CBS 110553]EXJ59347.1 hypothetical protein A1O5_12228 [Cladophialophora psammophila CBS 110553]